MYKKTTSQTKTQVCGRFALNGIGAGSLLSMSSMLTPSFTALKYKEHDAEFLASISEFKKIVKNFDPDRIMWNDFMDQTIWSVV